MISTEKTEGLIALGRRETLLTVAQVAEILHVHPNTLRRWADEGKINALRITSRGDRRFRPRDVLSFLGQMNPYKEDVPQPKNNGSGDETV